MAEEVYSVDVQDAVRTYADMVYRLASVNTGHSSDVEDIFQNVFLKLVQHRDRIMNEEHLKAWLIRVTINESRSHMTATWRKRNVALDAVPEVAASEKEDYSDVTQAVMKLSDKYRDVIHLYYYEELSIKEIAEACDLTEGAVKTRLRRGREMLNQMLKGEYGT